MSFHRAMTAITTPSPTHLIPYQVIFNEISLHFISPFEIVGAVTHSGYASSRSTGGSCLFVVAPTGGDGRGLITASENGGCCDTFGKFGNYQIHNYIGDFGSDSVTEGSSALVGGVVALILSANDKLTWRDVQHILIRTARHIDPQEKTWITNSGVFIISNTYQKFSFKNIFHLTPS